MLQGNFHLRFNQFEGHIFSTLCKSRKNRISFNTIFKGHHLEHELQIMKTLESSAMMMRREEIVALKPHCNFLEHLTSGQKRLDLHIAWNYLKADICLEGMHQPKKKHQSEVDQKKEAITIWVVFHKNCQLFGPIQQLS